LKCRFGIYVHEIRPNSITEKDGRLKKWDRILAVNDQTIEDFCIEKVRVILKALKRHKNVFLKVSRKLKSFETQPIAGASGTQKITSERGAMTPKIAFEPRTIEILKREPVEPKEEESQNDSSDSESDTSESDDSDLPKKLSVRLPEVSWKLDFNDPFLAPLNKQYEPKVLASGSQNGASEPKNVAPEPNPMASGLKAVESKPKDLASGFQKEASEPNSMASGLQAVASKPKDLASGSQNKTSEPNTMASGLKAVASKPKDLTSGSQNEASEPNSMASGLQALASKPKEIASVPPKVGKYKESKMFALGSQYRDLRRKYKELQKKNSKDKKNWQDKDAQTKEIVSSDTIINIVLTIILGLMFMLTWPTHMESSLKDQLKANSKTIFDLKNQLNHLEGNSDVFKWQLKIDGDGYKMLENKEAGILQVRH
jgi:hypothetical protein